jgi:RNA methyltransferase, TrmH family
MILTSLQNPKMKQAIALRNRKDRDETALFLIEGYRELLRYLENGGKPFELFYCPELFLGTNEGALIDKTSKAGGRLYECSSAVMRKLSYRDRPDGLVAVAPQVHRSLVDLQLGKTPFLVVAEAIEKPGNLGTILRSSDASGVEGLILCDKCTDIYNPNVVRASVGTLFTVPVFEAGSKETIAWLKERKIGIIAATPHAKSEFTQTNFTGPVAIVVGTEQLGLSKLWMDSADIQVSIPMMGAADSLNVATATTLLLYEVLRQRNG